MLGVDGVDSEYLIVDGGMMGSLPAKSRELGL